MSLIFQSIVHSTAIHVEVIQLSITLRRSSNADPNPYKSTNPKLFSKTLRCKITITPIVFICSSPGGGQPDPNHSPTMLNTCPSVITWSKSIKFILWTVFNDRFQISCSNLSTTVWHWTITSLGYLLSISFIWISTPSPPFSFPTAPVQLSSGYVPMLQIGKSSPEIDTTSMSYERVHNQQRSPATQ